MSHTLRVLDVEDLPALVELERASQPLPWTQDALLAELAHPAARVHAVVDETAAPFVALLGYVALRPQLDEMWILNLATHPRARRRGVGARLMEASVAFARASLCTSLWLEVREGNEAARALYARSGLAVQGVRPGYYPAIPPSTTREAAVLMSRAM